MPTRLRCISQDRFLILKLESEDGLPRIERGLLAQLCRQFEALAANREYSGCIITGTEKAFAAGADINDLLKLTPTAARDFSREGQSVLRAIERSRAPVIAAIQGYCIGGGLDLALACHARIATPDAIFAHPGGSLGILTGWGGTQRLARLIGRALALEMLATGRKLDAHEALDGDLIRKVVSKDHLIPTATGLLALRAGYRVST
ncbi:MAG TPA: enoyl-CoA hydratase/isomerase family protein [Candidatus Acidoferrales bacterium]|nr:enoyl-CoA hydratase/isomerase family protein [Candidatus Acidoferrales bacterium]